MRWTVMTFNLRVNVDSDGRNAWPYRPAAVAAAIRQHDPDMVCIQEGLYSMLRDLEPLLEEYGWIGEGRRGGRDDEHCAIFCKKGKWKVVEQGSFGLSETPERLGVLGWKADYPRMCTWARLRSLKEEAFELAVFNTHLDHISEEAQANGMELVKSRIGAMREKTGLPVVLTGDFNVTPKHSVVRGLGTDGYRNCYSALGAGTAEIGRTFHDFAGGTEGEPIDYIFVTSDVHVERIAIDRNKYEGRYPSDHYPVVAVLRR
ncbi:endonuclease/exonuclease/phosphatase family protein [Cohnella sp. AR92]|uniref:endonuclease/exonuclease/phosphatase family protein n=1 Tax=Cohnella sp. AR92 TaxID=648716 RepID=UPI000F8EF1FC|nr:endonuclease/exonuclease/phosphatase family protein [Cohnella sp. AR92]RUS48996.1 endonuclease/exonuclease/phosphatase family protein [Cohnella sp. AR92]